VLTNVLNYPASEIRLSDLKGKLVILDFWGKYCAPCIKALPVLDSLQQIYKEQIQVIAISDFTRKEELVKAMEKYSPLKKISLPVTLASEQFSRLFPHQLLSHVIWISQQGNVRAFTGTDYVTTDNIRSVLTGKELYWKMKIDQMDFDYQKPLLGLSDSANVHPKLLYYSAFTSHIEGISPPNGIQVDSTNEIVTISFYNLSLLAFCQAAINMTFSPQKENFILRVKDSSRYIKPESIPKNLWRARNTFCYNLRIPVGHSKDELLSIVKTDIRQWLEKIGITITATQYVADGATKEKFIINDSGYSNNK
jgi:thiol-disulfide isomerase/thioredoxin